MKQAHAKQAETAESEKAAVKPLMDSATLAEGNEPEEGEEEHKEVDAHVEVEVSDSQPKDVD